MKKIAFLFLTLAFLGGFVHAQEGTMPTDEEILQTIRQYNFDKSKEDYLFKETKKQLQAVYEGKQNEPSVNKEDKIIDEPEPSLENPNKQQERRRLNQHPSLTSHPPLTRRSK